MPVGGIAAKSLQLGQQGGGFGLVHQRLAQNREGARGRVQALFTQASDLARHLDLIARVRRAGAFAQVHADEIFPQLVGLGGVFQVPQRRIVGLLVVGAPVPFKGALRILEHLLGSLGHLEHQAPTLGRVFLQGEEFLFDGDEPIAILGFGVDCGERFKGIGLLGIDFQHVFEGPHRLGRILQALTAQLTNLQAAGHALLGV